jgi:hypothetical protein
MKIGTNKNVKLLFRGRILNEDKWSVSTSGLISGSVVHCAVSEILSPQRTQQLRNAVTFIDFVFCCCLLIYYY